MDSPLALPLSDGPPGILRNTDYENAGVVKLHATFQDNKFLYMLMEFLPGGDLMTMLIKYLIFTEHITRFYMAEIIMAIEAVHHLGFIHRLVHPACEGVLMLTSHPAISSQTIFCWTGPATSNSRTLASRPASGGCTTTATTSSSSKGPALPTCRARGSASR